MTVDAFAEFVAVVRALRAPVTGCPWDLMQTHATLRRYAIEEAYEVVDAIDRADDAALCEELGDLLLQVVLHAQLAAERGAFDIEAVCRGIAAKMVRRHPHVFGPTPARDLDEVHRNWEAIKAAEKPGPRRVVASQPALMQAQHATGPLSVDDVRRAADDLIAAPDAARLGALLLAACGVAKALGLDAETTLRDAARAVAGPPPA